MCGAPLQSWKPRAADRARMSRHGEEGHFHILSQQHSVETLEELATSCCSHPDVWHDVGITHNASQEVRDLEFCLERGRRRGRWPSL